MPGDRQLLPYLRRARAIIALIARLGGTEELSDALRIRCEGQDLQWDDFFYGPGELDKLFQRLRIMHKKKQRFQPIAFVVWPSKIVKKPGSEEGALVGCRYHSSKSSFGGDLRLDPTLVFSSFDLTKYIQVKNLHLICGIPRLRRDALELNSDIGQIAYAKIYVDVFSRNQLARWPH